MDFDFDILPMLLKKLFCPLECFCGSRMRGHDRVTIVKPNNKKPIRHRNTTSLQPDDLFAFRFGTIVLQYCVSTSAKLDGRAPTASDTRATLQYERNRLLGGKWAFYQVDGVEQQFRLERLAHVSGLSKSVLLPFENQQAGRDTAALERGEHCLRLIDRHDRIVRAVEEYDWRRKILHN